jgi:hypothetical protein
VGQERSGNPAHTAAGYSSIDLQKYLRDVAKIPISKTGKDENI